MRRFLTVLLAYVLCGFAASFALAQARQHYSAPLHSSGWELSREALSCRLIHPVPRYGRAEFRQNADEGFQFRVWREHDLFEAGEVEVSLDPPAWRHRDRRELIGRFSAQQHGVVVSLDETSASQIARGLADGMMASLRYAAPADRVVRVDISGLNFQAAWQRFRACVKSLPGLAFHSLAHSEFFYGLNSDVLGDQAKHRLDNIAFYTKNSGTVKRIAISGFADDRGSQAYNRALSRERADAVKKYLISRGVSAGLIHAEGRGEEGTGHKNEHARQRRVEITLIK